MRSGLSTMLQTLTPEAGKVLHHSIAEAGRRNHNHTTPLHVAATLLAAPTGFLRQACIRSHPHSSHPLQCRALELCFSVALDRLPSATSSPAVTEPPVSNALMAALKRAQAHQRRGCPEQQQQPLLAVKVELEQLIISILDDPSVSRVMREAGFSSPAVKATIEMSLNNNNSISGGNHLNSRPSLSPATPVRVLPINRNLYTIPRLQMTDETSVSSSSPANLFLNPLLRQQKEKNLNLHQKVFEIMSKSKKKNPILVGEFELESIKKEILMRIRKGEFKNSEVISIDFPPEKSQIPTKIKELSNLIETRSSNESILLDLGDLKWLVELPPTAVVSDIGRESVQEMAKLVTKNGGVRLIGTATCETYLRCQVYHPSMENDWDLQAVPISSRSSISSRIGPNGVFGSSVDSLNSFRSFTMLQRQPDSARTPSCCPKCFHAYEQELARLNDKPYSDGNANLPPWLQNAKAQNVSQRFQVNDQQLLKKWSNICSQIHPNLDPSLGLSRMATGVVNKPTRLLCPENFRRSPVRTELVLGPHEDLQVHDFLRSNVEESHKGKFVNSADTESFKKLLKGLMKTAWWQPEAAATVATTVTQCGLRGGLWLLFAGPDHVAKKKMASVLAEHLCAADPITICLGSRRDDDETDVGFRGKTTLDQIVEVVRRKPFSVIVLSDIDEADTVVCVGIKQAMEIGRLTDSHGREISLGNIIFVVTGNWSENNFTEEKRVRSASAGDCRLKLIVSEKRSKRPADCVPEGNIATKQQKKDGLGLSLSLDLNLALETEEDLTDASDLTIERGDENMTFNVMSVPHELVGLSNGTVVFKPVQLGVMRREIEKTINTAFSSIVNEKLSVQVDETTLDDILNGIRRGQTALEEWVEQVVVPTFYEVRTCLTSSNEDVLIQLESDPDAENQGRDWLPSKINVIVNIV